MTLGGTKEESFETSKCATCFMIDELVKKYLREGISSTVSISSARCLFIWAS